MKKLLSIYMLIALAVIFASCGTNNNVVNNRLISKRKFNKGFHINTKGKTKSSKSAKEEESIAFQDVKKEKTNKEERKTNKTFKKKEIVVSSGEREVEEVAVAIPSSEVSRTTISRSSAEDSFEPLEIEPESNDIMDEEEIAESRNESKHIKSKKRAANSDVMTILLVILALIIAPLAVFIYEGATNRFWITLILWLVGIGVGYFLLGPGIAWLCGLIAAIYAILIVLGVI